MNYAFRLLLCRVVTIQWKKVRPIYQKVASVYETKTKSLLSVRILLKYS